MKEVPNDKRLFAGKMALRTGKMSRTGRAWALALVLTLLGAVVAACVLIVLSQQAPSPRASGFGRPGSTPVQQAHAETCAGTWSTVASPNASANDNQFVAVAAISPSDVWAVGHFTNDEGSEQALTEHWDGSAWTVAQGPGSDTEGSGLYGVAAISSSDVWTVGYGQEDALLEHWNGSEWSSFPSPAASSGAKSSSDYLLGVAALSSGDVWAAGFHFTDSAITTLIEHWNGVSWAIVPSPNPDTAYNYLESIAAVSSSDVWAVGHYIHDGVTSTLAEHWDGSTWSVAASPESSLETTELESVVALASNDVWAVGSSSGGTLTEHWDGSKWSIVLSPNGGDMAISKATGRLYALAALSSSDVWAIGSYTGDTASQTLKEHWDGNAWRLVPSPDNGADHFFGTEHTYGMSALPGGAVWAVSSYYPTPDSGASRTLIERYIACAGLPTQDAAP